MALFRRLYLPEGGGRSAVLLQLHILNIPVYSVSLSAVGAVGTGPCRAHVRVLGEHAMAPRLEIPCPRALLIVSTVVTAVMMLSLASLQATAPASTENATLTWLLRQCWQALPWRARGPMAHGVRFPEVLKCVAAKVFGLSVSLDHPHGALCSLHQWYTVSLLQAIFRGRAHRQRMVLQRQRPPCSPSPGAHSVEGPGAAGPRPGAQAGGGAGGSALRTAPGTMTIPCPQAGQLALAGEGQGASVPARGLPVCPEAV